MGWKRLAAVAMVSGLALLTAPSTATAVGVKGIGHNASGLQPNATPGSEWHGSYVWQNKHVWCVQYALPAPDSNVGYKEGDALRTKAGKDLAPDVAANISYLLLRYSTTKSPEEAAALAHLLHSWTAAPDGAVRLDTTDPKYLAYDAAFYAARLPQSVMDAVARIKADAESNRGPWALSATAPKEPLIIGAASEWTVSLVKANGKGVPNAPVEFTLTDATLVDGSVGGKVTTPENGGPVTIKIVPTGAKPSIAAVADSPADRPVVHQPIPTDNMQRIVTTGGEKKLNAAANAPAKTAPGIVKITKIDSETKKSIAGVALRVTAKDQTSPALKQDDSPLVGTDGKPLVLQTGSDGTVAVPDLRTPQEICLVEVAAPKGYEEYFDPKAPPASCGTVAAGQTLALELVNKPNKPVVPSTIPAGADGQTPVATASFDTQLRPGLMLAVGGLVLLGAALAGFVVWRRQ
ncbi:collagen binding domain-containing protein [Lentzea sp. NPDC051213]|uniref:collagen binding domain-containing protein n=1 Tax=Lentzea sp. NPDC051213 TaxID=3364126 RepID=UPI00379F807F